MQTTLIQVNALVKFIPIVYMLMTDYLNNNYTPLSTDLTKGLHNSDDKKLKFSVIRCLLYPRYKYIITNH